MLPNAPPSPPNPLPQGRGVTEGESDASNSQPDTQRVQCVLLFADRVRRSLHLLGGDGTPVLFDVGTVDRKRSAWRLLSHGADGRQRLILARFPVHPAALDDAPVRGRAQLRNAGNAVDGADSRLAGCVR